jgi:hypothetical protein
VFGLNVAVTVRAWSIVSWQLPVPEQSPDQPANTDDASGVAVSTTVVPAVKLAWQVAPQLIAAGLELTWPEPVPCFERVSANVFSAKVAMTAWAWFIVSWQSPLPEQSPDHPVKIEEASGVAVRLTVVPASKLAWQLSPQLIPAGLEVTAPEPVPFLDAVREYRASVYHCAVGASHQSADEESGAMAPSQTMESE